MGGKVLFLDFDGVLQPSEVYWFRGIGPRLMNCPGHELFENCDLLERELSPYADVRIVLSTSWVVRYRGSVRRLASNLGPSLAKRVVGATFHSRMDTVEFREASRGQQIWADVVRRKPSSWLALDDDDHGWPSWCRSQLVLTDPLLGIASPTALAELRLRLQEMHGHST
ncbi:HAD domain-containing protein [Caballeronia grimmiae]|uniref:HAD domain-containing protein n=1 Tax=Caballeronia grimmiae TaxID=1071679 RepID=UPI0038BD2080